jgi:hypothetical protein
MAKISKVRTRTLSPLLFRGEKSKTRIFAKSLFEKFDRPLQ